MMVTPRWFRTSLIVLSLLLGFTPLNSLAQHSSSKDYVPPEEQAADPEVRAFLESAIKLSDQGDYDGAFKQLKAGLSLCDTKGLISDQALLEARLAASYAIRGNLIEARRLWTDAYSNAVRTDNLVLQADTLVALSSASQMQENHEATLSLATKALDTARESKSLWIESRALGELGRIQFEIGKPSESRPLVEEALRIDRLNQYRLEAPHVLYLAQITATDKSKAEEAIQLAVSARELAVKYDDYLTFLQASTWLGQTYVQQGQSAQGIAILENTRNGVSEQGQPLFNNAGGYQAAMSLPLPRLLLLGAIAQAYSASLRPDDAFKTWQDVYQMAKASGFTLAEAGAIHEMAVITQAKKSVDEAISFYSQASTLWEAAGNKQSEINDLSTQASLLFQQGKVDEALKVDEEILPLTVEMKDIRRHFITDLAMAEIFQPRGDLERTAKVLKDAEALVPSDLAVQKDEDRFVLELYLRLAGLYGKTNDPLQQTIALEKALTPAERLGGQNITLTSNAVQQQLVSIHAQEKADLSYRQKEFIDALAYFELLQHFDEFQARQKGEVSQYTNDSNDPNQKNVLNLPFTVIAQTNGAAQLEHNLELMGPIAQMARLPILQVLSAFYMVHQQPEKAARFATAALPQLKLEEKDESRLWDGQLVCTLANALLLEKNIDEAVRRAHTCLLVAKKINDPQLLAFAHQTNVWVSEAAGAPTDAMDSLQFLTAHEETPSVYIQKASIEEQQGNSEAAIAAWKQALHLFEQSKDLNGMASVNLSLANALSSAPASSGDEIDTYALAALTIYGQLKDLEGQAKADLLLANHFAKKQDQDKAFTYFSAALKASHAAKRSGLEAYILAEIGRAYASSPTPMAALDYYHQSLDVYSSLHDAGNQALVLKDEASVLAHQHRTEEALATTLKAQSLADASGLWFPRFWTRWLLAMLYGNGGEYGKSITTLQEAESISDQAHQPRASALAALDLTDWLITIGNWEEALKAVNRALPVFERFKDTDSQLSAYNSLTEIFGARESDLKDFDKALQYYGVARKLAENTGPDDIANLSQDICEIYWQQGRFKEAIQEASVALAHYRTSDNEWGQASSLITMGEAQRSAGDINAATDSLAKAEPLVKRVNNFYMTGRLYYGQAGLMKKERNYKEAISKYTSVISLLEQFKVGVDSDLQRKVSENYGFVYDELLDSYYQLSIADRESQLSAADDALRYSELNKSRVFTNTWGRTFLNALRRQLPAELQERERSLALRRSSLLTEDGHSSSVKGRNPGAQPQEDVSKLAFEESALEKAIREADPAYAAARYPIRVSIAGLPLRNGETLVEFKMLQDSLLVWIIEGTAGAPHLAAFYEVGHPRLWFEDRILAIRDAFNRGHPDEFDSKASEELFQAIFPEPFADRVSSAPSIIFVPDDVLFLLPLEILSPRATASQFVFLKTPTTYFPSAAAFMLARAVEHTKAEWREEFVGIADPITSKNDQRYGAATFLSKMTAAGTEPAGELSGSSTRSESPTMDPSDVEAPSMVGLETRGYFFNRLPQTAAEVEGIAALFPPAPASLVRTGLDATKTKLLQTDLGSFRFIHFATHGFVPVEPGVMEPALILSYDGSNDQSMMLSLSEILQLKLHAEMVVLSACNTGSGKVTRAEGVASLGAAFLTAGASSTVMSLWKVSDLSTSLLMQEFYRNLLKGMPKNSALATARSTLASKGYANPFFWAPFVLTGE